MWAALDAGLRPIEVARATVEWVDRDNGVLRIPKAESSKNRDNWIVGLTDRTLDALARWLRERECYGKYDDVDTLWLTREANPYQSHSLNHFLQRVCDVAGIDMENRELSWYAIRHSVGTKIKRSIKVSYVKFRFFMEHSIFLHQGFRSIHDLPLSGHLEHQVKDWTLHKKPKFCKELYLSRCELYFTSYAPF